jgi:glycosyltransferase involved in cell wall biosynthesis
MPAFARIARLVPLVSGEGADPQALAATLDSLLSDRGLTHTIRVFAAARPAGFESHARLTWHGPASDLRSALRAIGPGDDDIAWIAAGTLVPAGTLQALQAALAQDPLIGSVSPCFAGEPAHWPFEGSPAHSSSLDEAAQWVRAHGAWPVTQIASPLPRCTVIRARVAASLREDAHGEPAEWSVAMARAGWLHAASSLSVVTSWSPDAGAGRAAEAAAGDAIRKAPVGRAARNPPVRLHVAHSWGGGLSVWVKDFAQADGEQANLVLRSIGVVGTYGQRLALYRGGETVTPLRSWEIVPHIHASATSHLQYRAVLREVIDDFGVDHVIVSSLIGHSLDALRTGLPTLVVAHDHYPLCVAIFASYQGECRQCDDARLADCIAHNPGHRFFEGAIAADWAARRSAFRELLIAERITMVAPSASVRERWISLMPELESIPFHVVPHGVSLPTAIEFSPPADGPLRLIMLGRLTAEKGSEMLEAILPELEGFAELTLLGCGDEAAARLKGRRAVTAVATYERSTLAAQIAAARPHLGLQLSVVPETFSYTLSELWHCAVPVLGTRIGSVGERIRHGENGYLVQPDAASVLTALAHAAGRRDELAAMRERLRVDRPADIETMVAAYRNLLPGVPAPPPDDSAGNQRDGRGAPGIAARRLRQGPISVDPESTYKQVARAFVAYTWQKAAHSPRLPAALRRLLGKR